MKLASIGGIACGNVLTISELEQAKGSVHISVISGICDTLDRPWEKCWTYSPVFLPKVRR